MPNTLTAEKSIRRLKYSPQRGPTFVEKRENMDRFGESARKGFDFLKSRAKETVEVTKLSSQMRELEERRDRSLLDIGHRVMAMFDAPNFDKEALRDRVEEVRVLNAEMEAAQQSVQELKSSLKSSMEEILPQPRGHEPGHEPSYDQAPVESVDRTEAERDAESQGTPLDRPHAGPEPPSYEASR